MNFAIILLSAALLVDGGFEGGGKSWNLPRECWSVVDGVGRNGSKAIVWENSDPAKYCYPGQYFRPEPYARYRFGGWMKVEDSGDGNQFPSIGIECVAADGTWLFGDYAIPVVDNDPNTHGWVRYEGTTRPMPENVVKGKLIAYIRRGGTGKVVFDSMELEQLNETPLVHLQSSAYRDTFCGEDGMIHFVAMLRLNTFRSPLKNWSCEFEFKNAGGRIERRKVVPLEAGKAEISVDAKDFVLGSQAVVFRLFNRDEIVSDVSLKVTRTKTKVPRRISIDSTGRVIKDGVKFFPIGLYSYWPTETMIKHWKGSPFNFVVQYGGVEKNHLDLWEKVGVSVCSDVRGLIYGYTYAKLRGKYRTFEESQAAFRKCYEEIGRHPAFFGWYLVDEAPTYMIPNVTAVNEFLREIDPDHPTFMVTDKVQDVREYMPTFDAVGVDAYPIGNRGGSFDKCSTWSAECVRQVYGMRPLWFVPQMFNWAWYRPEDVDKYPDVRMPTREEMANMTWQGIAAGANGICGYSFGNLYKDLKGEEFDAAWADVCSVGREVKSMERILLADDIDHGVRVVPPSLAVRGYRYGGKDVLLIVSRLREPVKTSLELKRRYSASKVGLGGGVALNGDNRLDIDFPACGYAIIALEGK